MTDKPKLTNNTPSASEVVAATARTSGSFYFSSQYIANMTLLDIYEIEDILSDKNKFGKSLIKGHSGQNLYFVRSPFSRLKDFWNTTRRLSHFKY